MTKCKYKKKPVYHETGMDYNGRKICVAEEPVNLLIRLKGTRGVFKLPWTMALLRAAMIQAAEVRIAKAAAKREKRKARTKR